MRIYNSTSRLKSRAITLLFLVLATGTPSIALANVGTPLMWATGLHMVFGNAVIGVLEGILLARIYRVPETRAILLMILANYFSAWVGWVWLAGLLEDRVDLNLYNVWRVVWGMIAAAYMATLVIEWPFVAGCFQGTGRILARSVNATLLVQSVSYVVLFGWYGLASAGSLFTQMTIVMPDQISLPANVRIYFIADADGNVYSQDLGSGRTENVFDLNSRDFADCLTFQRSASQNGLQEIVALLDSEDVNDPTVIRTEVIFPDAMCPQTERGDSMRNRNPGPSSGGACRLGSAMDSPWTFKAGFWPAQGLSGENSKTDAKIRFAFETPFVQWLVRHATLLPSDRVLFQLGKRQICIMDPDTKKVAVLCFGRGAVAVMDQAPSELR